jgi:hypothetical protein
MTTTTQGMQAMMDDNDAFLAYCEAEGLDPEDRDSRDEWDAECEDRAIGWAESRAEAMFEMRLMGE